MAYDQRLADEHLKRISEPEHIKKLRRQMQELDERDHIRQQEIEAEAMRQKIMSRGEVPVA